MIPLAVPALLALAAPATAQEGEQYLPPDELCGNSAHWSGYDYDGAERGFEAAVADFDGQFASFDARFSSAYAGENVPDAAQMRELDGMAGELLATLGRILPMRDAGNEIWPMKFLLEEMFDIRLPDYDPPDREEALRAAFLGELVQAEMGEQSLVRFLSRLEMIYVMLLGADPSAISETDLGALRILAGGHLAESYREDFQPLARRVLSDSWHTSLGRRLRAGVHVMCEKASLP